MMLAGPVRPGAGPIQCDPARPTRKTDADPAGPRDPAAPGRLSEDGRKTGRTLWADVDELLAKARPANKP
jgi:hypothetical protein